MAGNRAPARRTMGLIDSNFQIAVGANTAILLGAASGVLPAPVTAALHNGTTIAVLMRSWFARHAGEAASD